MHNSNALVIAQPTARRSKSEHVQLRVRPMCIEPAAHAIDQPERADEDLGDGLLQVAAPLKIIGAKIMGAPRDQALAGGANGKKFVCGRAVFNRDLVVAVCRDLIKKVDARDAGRALQRFADHEGVKRSALAEIIGISKTDVKELLGLTRILPDANAGIDSERDGRDLTTARSSTPTSCHGPRT